LYVIYLQPMIRAILENKDKAWLHIPQISTVTLSPLHCTESSHSTEALTPVLSALSAQSAAACNIQILPTTAWPAVAEQTTRSLTLGRVAQCSCSCPAVALRHWPSGGQTLVEVTMQCHCASALRDEALPLALTYTRKTITSRMRWKQSTISLSTLFLGSVQGPICTTWVRCNTLIDGQSVLCCWFYSYT